MARTELLPPSAQEYWSGVILMTPSHPEDLQAEHTASLTLLSCGGGEGLLTTVRLFAGKIYFSNIY